MRRWLMPLVLGISLTATLASGQGTAATIGFRTISSPIGYLFELPLTWQDVRQPASIPNADLFTVSPDGLQDAFVLVFDQMSGTVSTPLAFVRSLAASGPTDFSSFVPRLNPTVVGVLNAEAAASISYDYVDEDGVARGNQTIAASKAGRLYVFEVELAAGTPIAAPTAGNFRLSASGTTGTTASGGSTAGMGTTSPGPALAVSTPVPPCTDGQYAPNTAGTGCRVTGATTPTALCEDGTFDFSRSVMACAGHGGVIRWLGAMTLLPRRMEGEQAFEKPYLRLANV